jgi:hypothetical protein
MARVEVITGRERRRRWSRSSPRVLRRAPSFRCGAPRRHFRRPDVSLAPGMRAVACGFTPVLIAPAGSDVTTAEDRPTSDAGPAIEVEFAGRVRVRIPGSVPAACQRPQHIQSATTPRLTVHAADLPSRSDGALAGCRRSSMNGICRRPVSARRSLP